MCTTVVLLSSLATPALAGESLLDPALDRGDAKASFDALCAQLEAAPTDPRVPLVLVELRTQWDLVPDGKQRAFKLVSALLTREGVAASPGADSLRSAVASLQWALGNRDAARATQGQRGFVDRFLVVGPFGVTRSAALEEVFDPEIAASAKEIDTKQVFKALRAERRWQELNRKALRGSVSLDDVLNGDGSASYAVTHLRAPAAREVTLLYRGPSAKLWLNRSLITTINRSGERLDSLLRVRVSLTEGWNRVLLKVLGGSDTNFSLQITDSDGRPLKEAELEITSDVKSIAPGAPQLAPPMASESVQRLALADEPQRLTLYAAALRRSGRNEEALVVLEDLKHSHPAVAETPWFLIAYGQAIEGARNLPQASRREQARTAYRAVLAAAPKSVRARRRLAEFLLQDDNQKEGVETLEAILADHPGDIATRLRLHDVLIQAGWLLEAEQVLGATPTAQQQLVPVLRAKARMLDQRGRRDAAQAMREELLKIDPSQTWVILRRMDAALARGNAAAARTALADYEKQAEIRPDQGHARRAQVARAFGNSKGVLDALRAAVDASPWHVGRRLALAERLCRDIERGGQAGKLAREETLGLLNGVLGEKPELHTTRRLRDELTQAEDRFWEEWAPDVTEVLKGAPDAKHWPQASTVCLFDQQVTRIYPDTSTVDVIHQIWRILDEGGIERYGARPKSGELLAVRTLTPTGETLEPIRASGGSFQMPGLSAGSHVEHAFKIESGASDFQLTGGPFYFQDPDLTEPFWLSRWVIMIHKDAPVRVVQRNMRRKGITKSTERRGDWTVHVFTAHNQPRIQPEPGAPSRDEFLPWVKIVETRSLDEIGSFYKERATNRATTPSVARKAAELVFGLDSDEAKARVLFDFVQTHVTRNSGGFSASQILAARGGNKNTLLLALLNAADVPHQLLLAAPEPNDAMDWDNPEPGQFNTPLIRIDPSEEGAAPFYLFAGGHRLGPVGRLPSALRGAPAFVCDPAGGSLETLPSEPLTSDVIASTHEVTLLAGGGLSATVRRTMPAYGLYRLKELFGTLPKAQVRGWFAQQANQLYPGARVLSSAIPRREEPGVPLTITFTLQADGAVRPRGDGRLELRGLVPTSGLTQRYGAHRHRVFDLVLRDLWAAGGASSDDLKIALGPYACPRLPESVTINNRFGQFSLSYTREGADRIRIRRSILLRPGRVRPRHFAEFRAFLSAIDRAERAPLVVEERRS